MAPSSSRKPATVLCAGIAVQDLLFKVDKFPPPGGKTMTHDFMTVCGGCAVNAAIAVARLGGSARYTGPLGDAEDNPSNQLIAAMQKEGIDTAHIVRVAGAAIPVSGIMIDATGERIIVTYRDRSIEAASPPDLDRLLSGVTLLLADNRFPDFVRPICEAARRRGIPVVLDADRPTTEDDPLFGIPSHVVFSSECLRATTGQNDLGAGLKRMAARTKAFLAVSDGPNPVRYIAGGELRSLPVFQVDAIDTLAAGDVFHAGFALALAEGRDEIAALRFGAAAAGLKCTRFGGSMGAPPRADVENLLQRA
jgi:sugar/nucleoside kinase (ribokinase family)